VTVTVLESAPVSRVRAVRSRPAASTQVAADVVTAGPQEPVGRRHALAVTVASSGGPEPSAAARAAADAYGVDLDAVIGAERVRGSAGEVVRVPVPPRPGLPDRLLLVGVGQGRPRDLRRAGAGLARAVRGYGHCVTTLGDGSTTDGVRAAVEGLLLGGYRAPSAGLRERRDSAAVAEITLVGDHAPSAVAAGLASGGATVRARDLAEMPAAVKTPAWLAGQAVAAAEAVGLRAEVWEADRLAAERFGGVLAVGAGSDAPPCFVRIDHRPPGAARRPVVIVGKGITYDTGGISIKPRESMVSMKTDMSGAAATLSAVVAAAELGVRRPVTALLPIAQNAFGASSYRPSDVVTVRGGTTVEILNTDAEGRMVLADALSYAAAELDPEVIVDIATLTGAATMGLGRRQAALYATTDRLARAFVTAGAASGEEVWRMPLVEEYRRVLDSSVADLRHVPVEPVGGGSITAALFLREFTGGRPWVHLDIAGTARSEREEYEISRGATGFGARLLIRWLEGLR
jgi:leucyl aminopeptidase